MALLNKWKDDRPDGREGLTVISEEAYFHGMLAVKGSLRVDGAVEGDITDAISVSVGKKGRIKGNIAAEVLAISGEVHGDVVAARAIEILSEGRLQGNIRTPSLRIEEGAFFEGGCSMAELKEGRPAHSRRKSSETESTDVLEQTA